MKGHPERRVYFFIAKALGMTVNQFLNSVPSKEITEWIAFFNIQEYERNQKDQRRKQEVQAKKASRGGF